MTTLLATILAPFSAFSFPAPTIHAVTAIAGLPRATHHGLVVTIESIFDPSLQSFKVEVSRDSGATWRLFSDEIRPYDARHLLLPYRTKNYGLATSVQYHIRLCANYSSEMQCSVSPPFTLPIITSNDPNENKDTDDDILTVVREWNLGTDPRNPDSDDDQMADGFELGRGLDPNLTQRPRLEATPTDLDFAIGMPNGSHRSQHRIVTIANNGERVLRITDGLFSGNNPNQFLHQNGNLEVEPKQSLVVALDFLPTALGLHNANFDLLSDDRANFPTSIVVRGTGEHIAHLEVRSDPRLDFGAVAVGGESAHKSVTITNSASDRPLVASLFVQETLNFLIIPNRLEVPPGGEQSVEIFFVPEWPGSYEGMVEVRGGNAAGSDRVKIPITAQASGAAPSLRLAVGGIVFGTVAAGSEATRQLIIFNDGDGILYVKKIDFGQQGNGGRNGFRLSSMNLIVPPHGSNRINVTFKPSMQGQYTSQICLVTNAASQGGVANACNVVRSIGHGVAFPNASHSITLSGVGS